MALTIKVTAKIARADYERATNTARVVPPGGGGDVTDFLFTVARRPNPRTGQDDIKLIPTITVDWKKAFIKVGAAPATEGSWIETGINPSDVQVV